MYTWTGVTVNFAGLHKEARPRGKTDCTSERKQGCRVQDSDRLHPCNSEEYDIIVVKHGYSYPDKHLQVKTRKDQSHQKTIQHVPWLYYFKFFFNVPEV